jgi:hypothetical protein
VTWPKTRTAIFAGYIATASKCFRQTLCNRRNSIAIDINMLDPGQVPVSRQRASDRVKSQQVTDLSIREILDVRSIGFWNSKIDAITQGSFSAYRGGKSKLLARRSSRRHKDVRATFLP